MISTEGIAPENLEFYKELLELGNVPVPVKSINGDEELTPDEFERELILMGKPDGVDTETYYREQKDLYDNFEWIKPTDEKGALIWTSEGKIANVLVPKKTAPVSKN